jgi:galactokinase
MTEPQFLRAWTSQEGAERARAGFRTRFGHDPAAVWAAPGRVNLIGEHTDYNGGLSLPIALPQRTYFAASPTPGEDRAVLSSAEIEDEPFAMPMAAVAPGAVTGWAAYSVGVTWALRRRGFPAPALTGHVTSCVPFGAGLSSSAALEAATALAAVDLAEDSAVADAVEPASPRSSRPQRPSRQELAHACVEAENQIAAAPTGGMDQAAVLLCPADHALLVDMAAGTTEPVPFDLARAGLELLVIDTRAKHALVDGSYGQRRATCAEAAAFLGVDSLGQLPLAELNEAISQLGGPDTIAARRVRHVVTEIDRTQRFVAALRADQLALTGALMNASHASLRDDYEVSSPELDLAVEAARPAGALGARMTGGGFGGSAIALIPQGAADAVACAVAEAFAQADLAAPAFLLAKASAPAERIAYRCQTRIAAARLLALPRVDGPEPSWAQTKRAMEDEAAEPATPVG